MTCNVYAAANQLKSHYMVTRIENCIAHVCTWCAAKRLQLNADKTEILWFGSAANLRKLSADSLKIRVGQSVVKPVTTVQNLGVLINAKLSMRDHVSQLVQTCFFHLRGLCSVRHQLGQDVTERLVCVLILSQLDYCNAVLTGSASTLAQFAMLGTLNSEDGYELVLGTRWFGYELAVGTSWSGYELVLCTSWLGYELAWYDLARVRVDWHPCPSVCLSVTLAYCIQTRHESITFFTNYN